MRKRYIAIILVIVIVAVWIVTAPFIADALVVSEPLEKADIILVLSGSAEYVDRTHEAAAKYAAGTASVIWLTNDGHRGRWDDNVKGNPYFVDRAFAELVNRGVPETAIEILPGTVHGTDEEASLVVPAAAGRHIKSILLVTSPFHSRRALWTFRRQADRDHADIQFGIVTREENYRYPTRLNWWMHRYGWRSVGMEYVKFVSYWLFY